MEFRITFAIILLALVPLAPGGERDLRLFMSTIGLSDPGDVRSPAMNPFPEFGVNPVVTVQPNQRARLYVRAKFEPAGPPVAFVRSISFFSAVAGQGGAISGFAFWKYSNGTYVRWQQRSTSPTGTTNNVFFRARRCQAAPA